MKTKLILDTDLIAIESEDKVTLMVDLTAPVTENRAHARRVAFRSV